MSRYKGTVGDLKGPNKLNGFIKLDSVTHADGRPAALQATKDIFIHNDEVVGATIAAGMEVIFQVADDAKRPGGLRARRAVPTSLSTIENGIELHIDEQVIDHPLVPIRWCIKPDSFARMEAAPDRQWTLIVIAKTKETDTYHGASRYTFKSVVGVRDIGLNRTYFSFPAPGEYDFVAYLISSDLQPDRLKHLHGELESFFKRRRVWDVHNDEISLEAKDYVDDPMIIEATTCEVVSVPDDIFAKPLPQWAKTWLGYFGLDRPQDECSMRGRSILAFTLGVAWFLIWESLKRSYMLLLGVIHLVLGGSPLPVWREAFAPRLSALISGPGGKEEFEPLTSYRDWRRLRHPAFLLALAGLAALYIAYPGTRSAFHQMIIVTTVIGILASAAIYFLVRRLERAEDTKEEREREEALKAVEEATRQLTLIRTYAMCGVGETQKAPTSIKLVWTGIKRKVCRAYI